MKCEFAGFAAIDADGSGFITQVSFVSWTIVCSESESKVTHAYVELHSQETHTLSAVPYMY